MPDTKHDFAVETHPLNEIRRTVAILSGKGGVGKSMVTALLATYLQRTGRYRVGVLDADVTGPSIPRLFGTGSFKPRGTDEGLFPVRSHSDIQLMSINLLLDDPEAPVVWRGPILAGTVKQFWSDVIWGDLDFLLIDMPPGTGDIPLTVFQSLPLDGIILVTSPQDLVGMIVQKAINMARMMQIPILGMVENMSYAVCPHCGKKIPLFGEGKTAEAAQKAGIAFLGSLPLDPDLTRLCDEGQIERIHKTYLTECLNVLQGLPEHGARPAEPVDHTDMQAGDFLTEHDRASLKQDPGTQPATADIQGGGPMLIAVAAKGDVVAEHFGHCDGFSLFTVECGRISEQSYIANPGHKPGFLPNYLHDKGVHTIIAGGMGSGAVAIFQEKGIDVVTGCTGSVADVMAAYLNGNLESSGSVCHEHQQEGSCSH